MATREPRVAVTLPTDVKCLYQQAAESMGISTSKLAAKILIDASPQIRELNLLLSKAKSPEDYLKGVSGLVRQSNDDIQADILEILCPTDSDD